MAPRLIDANSLLDVAQSPECTSRQDERRGTVVRMGVITPLMEAIALHGLGCHMIPLYHLRASRCVPLAHATVTLVIRAMAQYMSSLQDSSLPRTTL